jgi:hypothetical protein
MLSSSQPRNSTGPLGALVVKPADSLQVRSPSLAPKTAVVLTAPPSSGVERLTAKQAHHRS